MATDTPGLTALEGEAARLAQMDIWDERALAINLRILELNPKSVAALNRLGKYWRRNNDRDKATQMYERVLEIDPENRIAANGLLAVDGEVDKGPVIGPVPIRPPDRVQLTGLWLFQCNPQEYSLIEELSGWDNESIEGYRDEWSVSRYRDDMNRGDPVAFWEAGTKGGLVAIGELTGPPRDNFLTGSDYGGRARVWVSFRLTGKFPQAISRGEILAHPILRNMTVIHWRMGANFPLTHAEWQAIQRLLRERAEEE